jgi:hypothetical protein
MIGGWNFHEIEFAEQQHPSNDHRNRVAGLQFEAVRHKGCDFRHCPAAIASVKNRVQTFVDLDVIVARNDHDRPMDPPAARAQAWDRNRFKVNLAIVQRNARTPKSNIPRDDGRQSTP